MGIQKMNGLILLRLIGFPGNDLYKVNWSPVTRVIEDGLQTTFVNSFS